MENKMNIDEYFSKTVPRAAPEKWRELSNALQQQTRRMSVRFFCDLPLDAVSPFGLVEFLQLRYYFHMKTIAFETEHQPLKILYMLKYIEDSEIIDIEKGVPNKQSSTTKYIRLRLNDTSHETLNTDLFPRVSVVELYGDVNWNDILSITKRFSESFIDISKTIVVDEIDEFTDRFSLDEKLRLIFGDKNADAKRDVLDTELFKYRSIVTDIQEAYNMLSKGVLKLVIKQLQQLRPADTTLNSIIEHLD
jgi:hypothetical protein